VVDMSRVVVALPALLRPVVHADGAAISARPCCTFLLHGQDGAFVYLSIMLLLCQKRTCRNLQMHTLAFSSPREAHGPEIGEVISI
jgi:hypothetical protein